MSHTFTLTRSNGITLSVQIADEDASLEQLRDAFETYLLACGFYQDSVDRMFGVPPVLQGIGKC